MPRGGKREGAGRKPGTVERHTHEKNKTMEHLRQRVMQNVDKLLNAQMANALGSVQIFEVIEHKNSKGNVIRTEHRLVEDAATITQVLDEGQGVNCSVGGGFYIVARIIPETRAADSMLDRTFGKASQSIEVTTDPRINDLKAKIQARAAEKGTTYEKELELWNEKYSDNVPPEIKTRLISDLSQ